MYSPCRWKIRTFLTVWKPLCTPTNIFLFQLLEVTTARTTVAVHWLFSCTDTTSKCTFLNNLIYSLVSCCISLFTEHRVSKMRAGKLEEMEREARLFSPDWHNSHSSRRAVFSSVLVGPLTQLRHSHKLAARAFQVELIRIYRAKVAPDWAGASWYAFAVP